MGPTLSNARLNRSTIPAGTSFKASCGAGIKASLSRFLPWTYMPRRMDSSIVSQLTKEGLALAVNGWIPKSIS